jgi:hypothetical protein
MNKLFLLLFACVTAHGAMIANYADFESTRWAKKNIPAQGGTISGSSYLTGNLFMLEAKWWGFRPNLGRVGLYRGDGTNSVICPIIYDWSGNSGTETNDTLIASVATNFSEAMGYKGNGTTQYINPGGAAGLGLSSFTVFTNLHIAAYIRTPINETSFSSGFITGSSVFGLAVSYGAGVSYVQMGNGSVNVADTNGTGLYVTARIAGNNAFVYKNGVSLVSDTSADAGVLGSGAYVLHALNNAGSIIQLSTRAQSYYSLGTAIHPAQQATYNILVRSVQVAKGRNVN